MAVALIVITLVLVIAAVTLLWPMPDATVPAEDGGAAAGTDREVPTTLEGTLVSQLVGGAINQAQYRREMARLAARDGERNPLALPGIDHPGEPA